MTKKLLNVLFCLGFISIAFTQDTPVAVDVGGNTNNDEGEFTGVIPVDPEDWLQPHEFPVDPNPEIIIEEEEEQEQLEEQELGEFTEGIVVGPGDFLIPPFVEDAAPGELVFSEEETELGEFTGGILINNNDSLVIEYEEELEAPTVVEEAELVIGEFYNGETEMNVEDVEVLNDGFLAL